MKKIVLLGGSTQQIPAILYAKKQGHFTILCDYLIDNPGQHFADRFYCVSTTDHEAVFQIAQNEQIHGIVAYASDPAAPTAAYVAEKLNLPTNPLRSVEILSYKDQFREFLKQNGFHSPKAFRCTSLDDAKKLTGELTFPVMVKPIDASGSKGISKITEHVFLVEAFQQAITHSRSKVVLIEEAIHPDHPYMIAGDCFVVDGKVALWGLLNSHRDIKGNPFVPIGTSYPVVISDHRMIMVKEQIQRLFDLLDIRFGAFNIEIMFDQDDRLFFIEVGPRNGGNMIPELLQMITGVDLVAATVEAALGHRVEVSPKHDESKMIATYVLHSKVKGKLEKIDYKDSIKSKIIKSVMYKKKGDEIDIFDASNKAVGIIFAQFESDQEMTYFMEHADDFIRIDVDKSKFFIEIVKSQQEIFNVLLDFDTSSFKQKSPSELNIYAKKLAQHAHVCAAFSDQKNCLGFIAFYANDTETKTAYVTQIHVKVNNQGKGIGKALIQMCYDISKQKGMEKIRLEVKKTNSRAIEFYRKEGFFYDEEAQKDSIYMVKGFYYEK